LWSIQQLLQPDNAAVTVCAVCAREGRAQTAPARVTG